MQTQKTSVLSKFSRAPAPASPDLTDFSSTSPWDKESQFLRPVRYGPPNPPPSRPLPAPPADAQAPDHRKPLPTPYSGPIPKPQQCSLRSGAARHVPIMVGHAYEPGPSVSSALVALNPNKSLPDIAPTTAVWQRQKGMNEKPTVQRAESPVAGGVLAPQASQTLAVQPLFFENRVFTKDRKTRPVQRVARTFEWETWLVAQDDLIVSQVKDLLIEKLTTYVKEAPEELQAEYTIAAQREYCAWATGSSELNWNCLELETAPPGLAELKKLRTLTMRLNCLREVPAEIDDLPNLTHLNISFNSIETLPNFLRHKPDLQIRHDAEVGWDRAWETSFPSPSTTPPLTNSTLSALQPAPDSPILKDPGPKGKEQ